MREAKKKILAKLKNTYCRLGPSKIHGVGVFAVRNIPAGTNPFKGLERRRWYKFKMEELKHLDGAVLKMIDDFFGFEKDGTVFLPECGLNGIDISFFLNSSSSPNLKTIDGGSVFIALREIKKGEELTVDYKTYEV